jgi:hypothetical protein
MGNIKYCSEQKQNVRNKTNRSMKDEKDEKTSMSMVRWLNGMKVPMNKKLKRSEQKQKVRNKSNPVEKG